MQSTHHPPLSERPYAICCFTGHREIPNEYIVRLSNLIDETILTLYEKGVRTFRAGGAMGFDTLASLRVIRLKEVDSLDLTLDLYLPCRDQTKYWPKQALSEYNFVLEYADSVTYISEHYHHACMHMRNRALVQGSDYCVSYLIQNKGGTAHTVSEALKNGLTLINLGDYFLSTADPQ